MAKEKTALEKSHSKWSNTKLTTLGFFLSLFVTGLWIGIALMCKKVDTLSSVIVGVSALGTVLGLILFSKFKR